MMLAQFRDWLDAHLLGGAAARIIRQPEAVHSPDQMIAGNHGVLRMWDKQTPGAARTLNEDCLFSPFSVRAVQRSSTSASIYPPPPRHDRSPRSDRTPRPCRR